MKHWEASAPANIALIKYMGKTDASANIGSNPSLSLSLESLRTQVSISLTNDLADSWQPLGEGAALNAKGQERYLRFFAKIKKDFGITQNFVVQSANNFPADAGIASSASSFAALTKVSYTAFSELKNIPLADALTQARISRQGSGSSCRSFFSPWCSWDGHDKIEAVTTNFPSVCDFVIAVESGAKSVSSSEAHLRVASSALFLGRTERAKTRMALALKALQENDWKSLAAVSWADFWDMHSLFHTSEPPFFYFKPGTMAILDWCQNYWAKNGTGPIATIDAGPNVHLLVPDSQKSQYQAELNALSAKLGAKIFVS
jgi:diphosphomevalonate decarboxylase